MTQRIHASCRLKTAMSFRHTARLLFLFLLHLLCSADAADESPVIKWLTLNDPDTLRLHAVECLNHGEINEAHKILVAAATHFPNDPLIQERLGDVLIEREEIEAGMARLDRALSLKPDHYRARMIRAMTFLRRLHDPQKCIDDLDQLTPLQQEDPFPLAFRAEAMKALGKEFDRSRLVFPRIHDRLIAHAMRFRRQGRMRLELDALLTAATIKPARRQVALRIAVLLEKLEGVPGKPETFGKAWKWTELAFWCARRPLPAPYAGTGHNKELMAEKMVRAQPTLLDALRICLLSGNIKRIDDIEYDLAKDESLTTDQRSIANAVVAALKGRLQQATDSLRKASSPESLAWKALFLSKADVDEETVTKLLKRATAVLDEEYLLLYRPILGRWDYSKLSVQKYQLNPTGIGRFWSTLCAVRDLEDVQIADPAHPDWASLLNATSLQSVATANQTLRRFESASVPEISVNALWHRYHVHRQLGLQNEVAKDFEAYRSLQKVNNLSSDPDWLHIGQQACVELGDYEGAMSLATEIADVEGLRNLVGFYIRLPKRYFRDEHLELIIRGAIEMTDQLRADGDHENVAEAHFVTAMLFARKGDHDEARRHLRLSAETVENNTSTDSRIARLKRNLPILELILAAGASPPPNALFLTDPNGSLDVRTIEESPRKKFLHLCSSHDVTDSQDHFAAADYFLRTGELETVAVCLRRAHYLATLDPKQKRLSFPRSVWPRTQENMTERQRQMKRLNERLMAVPFDCRALSVRADLHRILGNQSLALSDLDAVISTEPTNAAHRVKRGRFHLRQQKFQLALDDGQAAVDRDSSSAAGFLLRGRAQARLGNVRRAVEDFRLAARNSKKSFDSELAAIELMWVLSTTSQSQYRDPHSSLELLRFIGEENVARLTPYVVAAVYAAYGDFERAVEAQNIAITVCTSEPDTQRQEHRLAVYQSGKALYLEEDELYVGE